MKIKPLFDRIIVKETNVEESKTSLILHSTSEDKPLCGLVLCVGDGLNEEGKQIKMQVKPKDKVVFSKYCAVSVRLENEEYFILRQSDVLCILGE